MGAAGNVIAVVGTAIGVAGLSATSEASALNHVPPARAPCSVLSGHSCHPLFCGVFHHGPCLPSDEPTLPETLRLTIVSTDENDPANKNLGDVGKIGADASKNNVGSPAADHALDSIKDMFAALRDCWVPPPKDAARHGMEYTIRFAFKRDGEMIAPPRMTYSSHDAPAKMRDTYRDAIDAALKRCTPLHFSAGMGEAIAGRPIAVRFVDDRMIDKETGK